MSDRKLIGVLNQKGGVGKTTSTTNLGHALARSGHRVLVVDLDPQSHLAPSLGLFKAPRRGTCEWLLNEAPLDELIVHTRENLSLLAAGRRLREFEEMPGSPSERARLLQAALQRDMEAFDYILFDCPPSSGLLVANAILAVDEILVPVTGDYLSLNGLAHLLMTLKRFESYRDRPMEQWFFLSRFVARRRLSKEVAERLLNHFSERVLSTPIREAAALAECPAAGRTIFEYRRNSNGADDFSSLAQDLVERRMMA